jgi:protein ImuB
MDRASGVGRQAMSYLCLHAAAFPAQALLFLRPEKKDLPMVVMENEAPFERVCSMNPGARALGAAHGMTRAEVEDLSGVLLWKRSLKEESSVRSTLLACAANYTPRIEDASSDLACTLILDLAGTERLLGVTATLADDLKHKLHALGIEAAAAISNNVPAALAIARTLSPDAEAVSVPEGQERQALASLPLSALELDPEHAELFQLWGIHTLGELAALPEKELISRLGDAGGRLHLLARGAHPHLFQPLEPVLALEQHAEFEDGVEVLDSLLFVLGPMLDKLIYLAQGNALSLLSLTLTLHLRKRETHVCRVRPALPSADKKFLLKLLHLELTTHPPCSEVLAMHLEAEPGRPSKEQTGLFSPQLPDTSRLDVTLARIQSIVGEGNVGSPRLQDTHRQDTHTMEAFRVAGAHPGKESRKASRNDIRSEAELPNARMARRRIRPPLPAHIVMGGRRPAAVTFAQQSYQVRRAYGPWRSSGQWWNAQAWASEEWEVALCASGTGALLHCALVRDLVSGAWRVDALFD